MNVKRVKELLNELANECESVETCGECPLEQACLNNLPEGFWVLSRACDAMIDKIDDDGCRSS